MAVTAGGGQHSTAPDSVSDGVLTHNTKERRASSIVEKQIQAMFCTVASKVKMISAHHRSARVLLIF
jgi:hypothetical protein